MRKAGWQTPAELRALRLQAPGASGGGELPRPRSKPSSPPRCRPPRPGTPIPPPTLRASARAPPARPCPRLGRPRPRSAAEGRRAGRARVRSREPGKAAGGGPEHPPRSPHRRGRERRTHPADAMSATRPRYCRRLCFLRAEPLRRGGASRRPDSTSRRRRRRGGPGVSGRTV